MTAWICVRCAMQYPGTALPPPVCPICRDEREAVAEGGQRWTTAAALAADHSTSTPRSSTSPLRSTPDAETVEEIARRVAGFRFGKLYGGWWGHVVGDGRADAAEAVQRSARRYVARLRGTRP